MNDLGNLVFVMFTKKFQRSLDLNRYGRIIALLVCALSCGCLRDRVYVVARQLAEDNEWSRKSVTVCVIEFDIGGGSDG